MYSSPRHLLGRLGTTIREYGFREAIERSALWAADRVLGSTLHRHSRTSLSDLAEAAASMHFSADELVRSYLFSGNADATLAQVHSEYETLSAEIARRYNRNMTVYPRCYAVEHGSAFLLYALVRSFKPSVVLETGVANGHSSFYILRALDANEHGQLHSIDCSAEVGSLLSDQEKERWQLHVLPPKGLMGNFLHLIDTLPPIDLFFHDSDHSYFWQSFEIQAALKKLSPTGVLASDDCDGCYAFLDVCKQATLHPVFLVEMRKVFGLAFLKQPAQAVSPDKDQQRSLPDEVRLARV